MRPPQVATARLIKSMNRSAVIEVLAERKQCSKSEITKLTGLSFPTVSKLISDLIDDGLVTPCEGHASTGGRPPIIYRFNAAAGILVGVDIAKSRLIIRAEDLVGAVVAEQTWHFSPQQDTVTPAAVVQRVKETISQLGPRVQVVAVSLPGIVDGQEGIVKRSLNLGWPQVPLADQLRRVTEAEIIVENDAVAATVGELYSRGNVQDTMVYLTIGRGIGAGIAINGEVFRGISNRAGAIGHAIISADSGPLCRCGQRGCLEAAISHSAIVSRAHRLGLIDVGDEQSGMVALIEMAEAGHLQAQEVLADAGKYCAVGINNLVLTIDPRRVIIGGMLATSEVFMHAVRLHFSKVNPIQSLSTEIEPSRLFPNAGLRGALLLAQRHFLRQ